MAARILSGITNLQSQLNGDLSVNNGQTALLNSIVGTQTTIRNDISGVQSVLKSDITGVQTTLSTLSTFQKPFGFRTDVIQSVQTSVPTWEWDARVKLAKASRSIVAFGSKEGIQATTCQANHISARVPTGYYSDGTFKYTVNPSAYDASGYVSWNGTISGTNGTRDLRDLDITNINPWVLATPVGCFLEETTASSLIKINILAITDAGVGASLIATDASKVQYVLPQQQWLKDNNYTVATAFATVHKPLYVNDPRCNATIHLHGTAELISSLPKGIYPLTFIQEMFFVQSDYIEYPGLTGSELVPNGDLDRLVYKNYQNYINECVRLVTYVDPTSGIKPTMSVAELSKLNNQSFPNPGNALNVPNWESKFIYILKNHGLTAFYNRLDHIDMLALYFIKVMQNFLAAKPFINDMFVTSANLTSPFGEQHARFISPEAKTYLDASGILANFRQLDVDASARPLTRDASGRYTSFGLPSGTVRYDGTIHSYLRAEQLDRWYRGNVFNVATTDNSWYDINLWGTADDDTARIYNDFIITGGVNFLTTNQPRLFADPWSNPFIRNSMDNPLFILNALSVKNTGESALAFYLPGYNL